MVSRSGILQHTLPVMVTHKPTTINQDIKAFFPDDRVSVDYLGAFSETHVGTLPAGFFAIFHK